MDNDQRRFSPKLYPGHIATVTVIALAYVVTLVQYVSAVQAGDEPLFTLSRYLIALALGVVYLGLFLFGERVLKRWAGRQATAVMFVLTILLMLVIQFLVAGSAGMWLIAMPLVATAVTELPPRPRWLVFALVILGMAAPIWLVSGSWLSGVLAALTFSPAIVFVVVFTQLTQRAEEAQSRSEALAADLEAANRALADYAVQAEELATIQERNRLAREIHDNLGHYLTVVNVQIKAAQAMLDRDPARAIDALDKAQQLTQDGLAAVRQSVSALRDSPLGGRTLPEGIGRLLEETRAAGIHGELQIEGTPCPLDTRSELTLYRAAQEALTNVRRHARASHVSLTLSYLPDAVTLCAADNGVGADAAALSEGFGLLGLRERARQLGGTVTLSTATGQGFELCLSLPTDAAEPSGAISLTPQEAATP